MIGAPRREPARARLPGRQARARRRLRRLDRPHARDRPRATTARARCSRPSRAREAADDEPRRPRDRERDPRLRRRERDLGAGRAAQARAQLRRPGRRLRLRPGRASSATDGTNQEGLYWRYEMWLRESESALGSITGGNGAIYAVRRSDYVEWPFGHDLGFPNLMVQKRPPRGLRARGAGVREALARQRGRVPAQGADAAVVVAATCSRRARCAGVPPIYLFELLSHRRPALRERLPARRRCWRPSIALVGEGWLYQAALAAQAALARARRRGQAAAAAFRAPGSPTTTC